jgi:hypothetical protein
MKDSWRVIKLTKGFVAIVSEQDFDRVKKIMWYTHHSKGKNRNIGQPYARAMIDGKRVYMHRFILNVTCSNHVDHRNFQTLDNRRENLRILPAKENIICRRNTKKNNEMPLFEDKK